jgi:hypothetical protein
VYQATPSGVEGGFYHRAEVPRPLSGNGSQISWEDERAYCIALRKVKTMTAKDYQCKIQASVSAKDAYDKIARVSEWWAKDFGGSARKLGDTFTVHFGETFVDFKISEAVPDSRIVWQVVNCNIPSLQDKTEWNGTSVAWDVSLGNGTTTVMLTHHGITPDVECYGMCQKGWNGAVQNSFLQFLNVGRGMPK